MLENKNTNVILLYRLLSLHARDRISACQHHWVVYICRWEYDAEHYCSDIRRTPLYETGPLLLDIIETCIFDFIIGNADRHHYEVFDNDPKSMLVMFDNGKRYAIVSALFVCITFGKFKRKSVSQVHIQLLMSHLHLNEIFSLHNNYMHYGQTAGHMEMPLGNWHGSWSRPRSYRIRWG